MKFIAVILFAVFLAAAQSVLNEKKSSTKDDVDDYSSPRDAYVLTKYQEQGDDGGPAFGYQLSDGTAVHQQTRHVKIGEDEIVPVLTGNYTYRTAKGLKVLVEWTADRQHGFRAVESYFQEDPEEITYAEEE